MSRVRFYTHPVVALVAGLLLACGVASCRKKPPLVTAPAGPAGSPPPSRVETDELEALRKREKELEALLAGLETAAGKTTIRQELMEELVALSTKLHLETYDFYSHLEERDCYAVERIPAILLGMAMSWLGLQFSPELAAPLTTDQQTPELLGFIDFLLGLIPDSK